LTCLWLAGGAGAQPARVSQEVIARICDEGTNRSQIVPVFTYLTDVIGPRLTASPQCRRANDWTRDKLASWGLTNAHLEAWGPFGRGWEVKRFAAQIVEPQTIPLIAWPKAWSYGLPTPTNAEVVLLDAKTAAELDNFKGRLTGAVVLVSAPREVPIHFDPLATRLSETNLLRLANAPAGGRGGQRPDFRRPVTNAPPRAVANVTNAPPTNPPPVRPSRQVDATERLRFAVREGAAATVAVSAAGDGGALMVLNNMVLPPASSTTPAGSFLMRQAWATNAPETAPQIVLGAEQYNRLVHMIQNGEKLRMALEVQTQFQEKDLNCYNTLAEIPGTDRRDELVMLGAHLDSQPGGTGATDNGAGVVVCMEAVRIIKALDLKPRRTIRIGLWTGEEQGLLGSRAYVARHFGYYTNQTSPVPALSPRDASQRGRGAFQPAARRALIRHSEYNDFSAYYNLDNGAGRIRGVYLQGNEALRAVFRPWLQALRDPGADTITAADTGGTDHLSFDAIGLPGFQFIQDAVEYWRSYHTTLDVRERAPVEDLQQAAIVMAVFVYQTAMLDEKLPRKPTN
jgi:carboxypeptidase Q